MNRYAFDPTLPQRKSFSRRYRDALCDLSESLPFVLAYVTIVAAFMCGLFGVVFMIVWLVAR